MLMRRACVVLGLLGCVARLVAGDSARADWQPAATPPPVPPETEKAQRARSTRTEPARTAPTAAPPTAADATHAPGAQPAAPVAATLTGPAAEAPRSHSGEAVQRVATEGKAGTIGAGNVDPLRLFPPAPPPIVPGGPPEKPNTALINFAPAPEPGPGQPARGAEVAPLTAARDADTAAAQPTESGDADRATADAHGAAMAHQAVADGGAVLAARSSARWSAAGLAGIGATFDKTIAGVNPMGFGFGVRGDYRLLPDWSLGARVLYFVGGSVELPSDDVAMQSWLLAAEGAYVLELDPVTIQPGLALGLFVRETNYRGFASFTSEPSNTSITLPDSTRLFLYVAPGVNVSIPLSVAAAALAPLSVGADVRLDVAFGRRVSSNIQLLLQVGLRF